jgi:hypothetical protein
LDAGQYTIKSIVPANISEQFVNFIEGGSIEITTINLSSLRSLSEEFGFRVLQAGCASFANSNQTSVSLANGDGTEQNLIRAAECYRLSAE